MNVVATAYTGYSTTSTGQEPVWGTLAVDPKIIPYGTKVDVYKRQVGALSVLKEGAQSSLPTLEDVKNFRG